MKNKVQLITYVDRLSGAGLPALGRLLKGPLAGVFGGVHLLPFYHPIDGVDAGFDPIDHAQVDPRLGDWEDVRALGAEFDVMADLIVNHVSCESAAFKDFQARGDDSPYAGMFLTLDKVFPAGASEAELAKIYRPRPGLPFSAMTLKHGEKRLLWTTFTSQQIDIDVCDPKGAAYLDGILLRFQAAGVCVLRLDAAGYAIKKSGTSCFMIPETHAYIALLRRRSRELGMEVLVEIHSYYLEQIEIAKKVDWVYDFALPPLVLHALYTAEAGPLKAWLEISPRNAITVLDTHDGIGVIDVGADAASSRPGLLSAAAIDALVETIHERSKGQSRQATGAAASNLDLYQVNCTYYDALGRDDRDYLLARVIQFFAPGIPQVYYMGLLAEPNDMARLEETGVGRDINRHAFTAQELKDALVRPVVRALLGLIGFRNAHPAFAGTFALLPCGKTELALGWKKKDEFAVLQVGLVSRRTQIEFSSPSGPRTLALDEITGPFTL